jgi:hypothetical protein
MPATDKPRYGAKQKVKGGVLKRARRRAKRLDRPGILKGGVTGAEARDLAGDYKRSRQDDTQPQRGGNVGGGVAKRARQRAEAIGGVPGVNLKDGVTRKEARRVRRDWNVERTYNPLTPRDGRGLLREAEAMTELQYGPRERALADERRLIGGRQNVIGDWFNTYQQQVGQLAQQQQLATQAFQAGAYQAAQQAHTANQQATQAQQQASPGTDPSVAATQQQANAGMLGQGVNFGSVLASIGAAQTGLMNQRTVSAGQERTEFLGREQARSAKVDQLARELAAERGVAKSVNVGQLKDTERKHALEREAFGLEAAETANDIAGDRAERGQEQRTNRRAKRARRKLNNAPPIKKMQNKRQRWDRIIDISDDGERNQSKSFADYVSGIKGEGWDNQRDGGSSDGDSGTGDGGEFTGTQVRGNRSSFENGRDIAYQHRGKGYQWLYDSMVAKNYDSLMAKVIAHKATSRRIPTKLLNQFEARYGFRPSPKGKGRSGGGSNPSQPGNAPGGNTTNTNTSGGDTSRRT